MVDVGAYCPYGGSGGAEDVGAVHYAVAGAAEDNYATSVGADSSYYCAVYPTSVYPGSQAEGGYTGRSNEDMASVGEGMSSVIAEEEGDAGTSPGSGNVQSGYAAGVDTPFYGYG